MRGGGLTEPADGNRVEDSREGDGREGKVLLGDKGMEGWRDGDKKQRLTEAAC